MKTIILTCMACLLAGGCAVSSINRSVVIYQSQQQNDNALSNFNDRNKVLPTIGNIQMEGGEKATDLSSAVATSSGNATTNGDSQQSLGEKAKEAAVTTAVKNGGEVGSEDSAPAAGAVEAKEAEK